MKVLTNMILITALFGGAVLFADGGFTTVPSGYNYWTQRADHPIRIEVIDTSYVISPAKGAFGMGDITPDFTKLTFNYHWPSEGGSMNFVLFIDGTYYSFASYPAFMCGTPIALYGITEHHVSTELIEAGDSSRIITKWQVPVGGGYVEVNQILTPVPMTYGEETYGTARIHYQIFNNDFMSHNIGLKLLLDVKVGNSDSPDIIVAGSYTASCQIYDAPVPSYWLALSDPSGVSTVARGTLRGADATPPDYFLIGDNWFFLNYPWINTTFGCEPDSSFWTAWAGTPTADVGVIYQWEARSVAAGAPYNLITYYGFAEYKVDSVGIMVFPIIPTIGTHDCELDTLVDFITLISQEDPAALTYLNDTICVSFSDPVEVDSVFWNEADTIWGITRINDTCVVFDSLPVSTPVNVTWVVFIPPTLSVSGLTGDFCYHANSEDAILSTDSCLVFTVPQFNRTPPTSTLLTVSPLYVNCTTYTIDVAYTEDEGVDLYSILPKIAGITSGSYVDITGLSTTVDTFHIVPPGSLFATYECFDICVPPLVDIHGCVSGDTINMWICYDTLAPLVTNFEPPDGGFTTAMSPTIGFTVIDSGAGLVPDSIQFRYRIGDGAWTNRRMTDSGVNLFHDAPAESARVTYVLTSVPCETTVTVCVTRVMDSVEVCSTNVAPIDSADTAAMCWTFTVDYCPPTAELIMPPDSGVIFVSCVPPEVCFILQDMSGVDLSTLVIQIGANSFDTATGIVVTGDTVCIIDVLGSYSSGDPLNISITSLSDTVGNAITAPINYAFTIDIDGPFVNQVSPETDDSCAIIAQTSFPCSIMVLDTLSDVDFSNFTVRCSINSGSSWYLSPGEIGVSPSTWIVIDPDSMYGYLDTVHFCLDTIYDNAEVCGQNMLEPEFCWCYIIDNQPPEIDLIVPEDDMTIAMGHGATVTLKFTDVTPIDESSLLLSINNSSPPPPGWAYNPFLNEYSGPVPVDAIIDGHCSLIDVVVQYASDTLGNEIAEWDTFNYYVDTDPPIVDFYYPTSDVAHDSVLIVLHDQFFDCSPLLDTASCFDVEVKRGGASIYHETIYSYEPEVTIVPGPLPSIDSVSFHIGELILPDSVRSGDSVSICVTCASDSLTDNTYGFNELVAPECFEYRISFGGPEVNLISPPRNAAISCSSLVVTFAVQDSDGVNPNTVCLSYQIDTGPVSVVCTPHDSIEFIEGGAPAVYDSVIFTVPGPIPDGSMVTVSLDSVEDVVSIGIAGSETGIFYMDFSPPVIGAFWPTDAETIFTNDPLIWAVITDATAGVDTLSACFTVDAGVFCCSLSYVYWHSDTLFFDTDAAGISFPGGTLSTVCIDVGDEAVMCDSNHLSTCWDFTVQGGGPIVTPIHPESEWIVTCDVFDSLIVQVTDTNGINWNTFHITITEPGGTVYDYYYPDPAHLNRSSDNMIVHYPPLLIDGTVTIVIEVEDMLGNGLDEETFEYTFIIDNTPSDILEYSPECGVELLSIPEMLWIFTEDSLSYADPNEFCVTIIWNHSVDTLSICGADTASIWGANDTLYIDLIGLGIIPGGGDTIVWIVDSLGDYTDFCAPNYTYGDTCRIPISSVGPLVTLVDPNQGADAILFYGCGFPATFIFTIEDADGFMAPSINVLYTCGVDTYTVPWGDAALSLSGDTLYWNIASALCAECSLIHIAVEVLDNMSNEQQPNDFEVYIDETPPVYEMIAPLCGDSVMSMSPDIALCFHDCTGADTMAINVRLIWPGDDLVFSNIDDRIEWFDDTLVLHTNGLGFSTFDSVVICIDSVYDTVEACPNVASLDSCCWVFIAQGGPEVTMIHPVPESLLGLICADDSFVITFSDIDGVNQSSVHFAVDGSEISIPSPSPDSLYWADETTLVYMPANPLDSSFMTICIWGQEDMLGIASDSICFEFSTDVIPPEIEWISAPVPPADLPRGAFPIVWRVWDTLNYPAPDSFVLVVDGFTYYVDGDTTDIDTLIWNDVDSTLTFYPLYNFESDDSFEICLTVGDTTGCGFSNLDTICWDIHIEEGAGPITNLEYPAHDSCTISCPDSSADFFIAWWCISMDELRHENALIEFRIGSGAPIVLDDATGWILYSVDTLIFAPDTSFADGDTFYVRIENVEDTLGAATSEAREYMFIIDRSGPVVISAGPLVESPIPGPRIWWALSDISPIDTLSPVVSVSVLGVPTYTFHIDSTELFWGLNDTLILDGLYFMGGDTVVFCLDSIADAPCICDANWSTDTCFEFSLPMGGPEVHILEPMPDIVTTCDIQDLVFTVCDSQGLIFDLLRVIIEHGTVTDTFDTAHPGNWASVEYIVVADTICDSIVVSPVSSWADGETVTVTVENATDSLFNVGMVYTWIFTVDLSKPIADNFHPPDGDTIWNWTESCSVKVWDEISALNSDSIWITIEDVTDGFSYDIFTSSPALWYVPGDSMLHFETGYGDSLWREFHNYCIHIHARDTNEIMYCPTNDTIISWCFYVDDDDSLGPEIFFLDTACFHPGDEDAIHFALSCSLYDTSGIYDDLSGMEGQGIFAVYDTGSCPDTTSYWGIALMEYESSTGIATSITGAFPSYIPAGIWLYYMVCAYDDDFDFENPDDRTQACSACDSCYFHDISNPDIYAIDPQEYWYYSCTCGVQLLILEMKDWDGIILDSGYIDISGTTIPFTDTRITFSGAMGAPGSDSTIVTFSNDIVDCWEHGDTVNVLVWGITDVYGNAMQDTLDYSFIIDWEPPVVWYNDSLDTNLYIGEFDTITIAIIDSVAGLNPDCIEIIIRGKHLDHGEYPSAYDYEYTFSYGEAGIEYFAATGELKIVIPRLGVLPSIIENEDSVWVEISDACDYTQSCDPNHLVDDYTYIKFIVAEFECRAHPNPFTPNTDGVNDSVFIDYPKMVFRDANVYIYDMQGTELNKISVGEGHTYSWDGKDTEGGECRPGVYLYVIEVENEIICTGSFVLAR